MQEPSYTGSVPVDQSTLPEGDEAAEGAALASMAGIEQAAAEEIAVAETSGGSVLATEEEGAEGPEDESAEGPESPEPSTQPAG